MTTPDLIDGIAVDAAVKWVNDQRADGKSFIKDFGVQQIIEAYEAGKKKSVADILRRDPDRIKRFREENGCSLLEARKTITRHQVKDALSEAATVDELKQILALWLEVLS